MPKSRLAFKVRDNMSSIYESSIMSSDECLSELEFKRPDYWQIKVPIISCITAANLGILTALGLGPNFVGALIVSWPAYEGLYYGVNRVRIWYVTYEIAEKKKMLEEVQKELAQLKLEREQERDNEDTNAKVKKETKLD